jgi:type III secretion system chaperone SycN
MSLSFALSEFGALLGVGAIDLPTQGNVSLQLSPGCQLTLEEVDKELLLYQMIDVPHIDAARSMALLQACNLRRRAAHDPCVQAGLRGEGHDAQVMLLVRFDAQNVQASWLQAGLVLLDQCRRDWLGDMN